MKTLTLKIFLVVAAILTDANWMSAQNTQDSIAVTAKLPQISLLTIGPGDTYYLLEGHSALRIKYDNGADITANWGVFNFNEPNFGYRFVKGETDYSIGLEPTQPFLDWYVASDRTVVEQPLNLTDAEVATLLELIDENCLPQNRTYRYNYVLDNCATRPLGLIEKSLALNGDSLVINLPQVNTSFRNEMRKYHVDNPGYQLFIDYSLGSGIDRPINPRQQAFAPVFLQELAASAQVIDPDGNIRNLVDDTTTLYSRRSAPYREPFPNPVWFALAILLLALYLTRRDRRRNKVSNWFDIIFYALLGVLGLLLAFLIFVSSHEATSPNFNFLWINPLCLIVPFLAGFRRCRKIVYCYQYLNIALIIAYIVCIPFFRQAANPALIILLLADFIRAENYISIYRKNRLL